MTHSTHVHTSVKYYLYSEYLKHFFFLDLIYRLLVEASCKYVFYLQHQMEATLSLFKDPLMLLYQKAKKNQQQKNQQPKPVWEK